MRFAHELRNGFDFVGRRVEHLEGVSSFVANRGHAKRADIKDGAKEAVFAERYVFDTLKFDNVCRVTKERSANILNGALICDVHRIAHIDIGRDEGHDDN